MDQALNALVTLRQLREQTSEPSQRAALDIAIAQLEAQNPALIGFDGAQVGDVTVGNVAGRDITTTIANQNQFFLSGTTSDRLAWLLLSTGRPAYRNNLSAPPYTAFVHRQEPFDRVVKALKQRGAIVLIHGLGGNGKTSLAYEIAGKAHGHLPDVPPYEVVVWVSDQHAPGSTTLETVLDAIAHTLDYPGASTLASTQKRQDIERILHLKRVLLVIDAFETVNDKALIDWIQQIPEPSRALITARERYTELQGVWSVDLKGMSIPEAHELLAQRLHALDLADYAHDLRPFDPVLELTECNPKAIEIVLGHLQYGRGLNEIINDLHQGRSQLFDHVFARSWSLMDATERQVLMAAAIFPASVGGAALEIVAGGERYVAAKATKNLFRMGLMEARRISLDAPSRYSLHPLVRTFAEIHWHDQPEWLHAARQRWVAWAAEYALQAEWPVHNLRQLDLLDQEDDEAIIFAALRWADDEGLAEHVLRIARGVDHYYYVRGIWDKKLFVDLRRIRAAQALGDRQEEARSIAQYVQLLCTRSAHGDREEAGAWLAALDVFLTDPAFAAQDEETASIHVQILHAFAFYHLASGNAAAAQGVLEQSRRMVPAPRPNLAVATLRWLGVTLYNQGDYGAAQAIFEEALVAAEAHNDKRGQVNCRLGLAKICNDLHDLARADVLITEALALARENKDRRYIAQALLEQARLAVSQGNEALARNALQEATDLFGRLTLTADQDRLYDTEVRLQALHTQRMEEA